MNNWRLDYAGLYKKGTRIALIAALLWGMLYTAGGRPAQAADVTVGDWNSLLGAFSNSVSGTTIILGADITQPSGSLTVPSATDLTLDLAGHTLSISSWSNAAIRVNAGTAITIEDSSADGTGKLDAVANIQSYAGIGGGPNTAAGTITINGGTVSATGGEHAAGIGSGFNAVGGTIHINGGVVNATGGLGSAGIGGGFGGVGVMTIHITGGTVNANGGNSGAGIGGGQANTGSVIHITGGTVNANGGRGAAGIGGGYFAAGEGGTIHINGGVVNATGGANGAGIGGGEFGSGGTIQITSGTVTATSGDFGAGIGGGRWGGGGTIAITGGTVIPSTGASPNVSVIGPGDGASDPSFDLVNAGTITIPGGYQLIIPEGVTVENSGTINGSGRITGGGGIENTGTITIDVAGPEVGGMAFELRFDLNGGTGSIPSITVYAATLQEAGVSLPEPVREGYDFEGWYTQPDGGDEMTGTYAISGDMDLFARWNAPEVTVADWDSLLDAFSNSVSGTTIILGADITQPSGALTVPSATDLTLDLAGYTLSIASGSNSAIRVNAGTAITIEDSSAGGTGRLVAIATGSGYAGIGGGPNFGAITINGGNIMASSANNAAGIGGGISSAGGTIHITGGEVSATGGFSSAGIGGGPLGDGGTITIDGGVVTAAGGHAGAGIGGGGSSTGVTVHINGGTVTANGGGSGAGIGGGHQGAGSIVHINGGTVIANGGTYSAGIGGGYQAAGGSITITAGTVNATGGIEGAGIGGGYQGGGGTIAIHGGTVIPSSGTHPAVSVIGPGRGAEDETYSLINGGTMTIPAGHRLIVPGGVTVENSGMINGDGSINGAGQIHNTGIIAVDVAGPEVNGVAYELRFDLNDGTGSIPSITVYAATLQEAGVTLPEPVREGYEFEGWYTQPDGGDEMTGMYAISGDMDLYARWKDVTPPTVTLSTSAGEPTNSAFEVTATFSEGVTGFAVEDIAVTNGTAGSWNAENGWTYTFVVTPTNDGEVTVEIPAGVAADAAGNGNAASLPLTRTYDGTAPTVTLSTSAGEPTNSAFEVTATFSEGVTGFAVEDIAVTNGTAGSWNAENGWTYTFVVTPTNDGEVTVEIPAGVAADAAGNGNAASLPLTRTYDGTAPTVALSSPAGDLLNGAFVVTATFSEGVTGFAVEDIAVTNGTAGSWNAENGWTYTFVVTPTNDGEVTVEIPAGVAADAAGNGNAASLPLTRTYDGTAPTVTLSSPAGDPLNGAFVVTATFSEGVTGFAVEDIAVTNGTGTVGSWNAENGWTYTFVVTPTNDGEVTVEIPAGVAADAAGNGNAASLPLTRTYDATAPVIELDPADGTEPAQSVQPVATVTDASELTALLYAWTPDAATPGMGAPEWQPFASGEALTLAVGDGDRYVHVYARDAAGNEQAESFGPYVLDNTAPVIGLNGESPHYLPAGQPYVEHGAWATDNIDGPLDSGAVTVTGEVHAHRPGIYEVRYAISDRAGNAASVTRSVYVYDADHPVITLLGDNPMVMAMGDEFMDPGATAHDTQDGDVTAAIIVTGSIDTHAAGTYTLTYNVSDVAGNAAPEASRTVHVIAPPVLILTGPAEVTMVQGGSFSDPGATASDAYYGDLSDRIAVSGSVDTQAPGVYTLRYTVANPIGQTAEATRTVTVRRASSPGGPGSGGGSGGGGDGGSHGDEGESKETENGQTNAVDIVLNGLSVPVDAVTETTSDGRTVVRLRLTAEQVAGLFDAPVDAVAEAFGSGEVAVLGWTATAGSSAALAEAIIVVDGAGDVIVIELPADALHGVRRMQPEARLRLVVDGHGLLVPLEAVERVSADAVVAVTIGRASSADSDAAKRAIAGLEAVALLAHPVVYTLTADGRPVGGWDGAYRERTMTLPAPADTHRSTAVWIDERGGLHFVPSVFEGVGRAVTLPTRQDGAYTVIRSNRVFRDLQAHWARDEVEQLANKRIVEGRETGAFAPSDPVTRAEFAALLVRGLGLPERQGTRSFTDVSAGSWYAGAVEAASEAGLVHGYGDGTFRPQERITREQMTVMIVRAMAYAGQAPEGAGDRSPLSPDAFADEAEIAEWAKEAVAQLAAAGIIQGLTATEFAPQANASRAQSAVMLKRLLDYLGFINP